MDNDAALIAHDDQTTRIFADGSSCNPAPEAGDIIMAPGYRRNQSAPGGVASLLSFGASIAQKLPSSNVNCSTRSARPQTRVGGLQGATEWRHVETERHEVTQSLAATDCDRAAVLHQWWLLTCGGTHTSRRFAEGEDEDAPRRCHT